MEIREEDRDSNKRWERNQEEEEEEEEGTRCYDDHIQNDLQGGRDVGGDIQDQDQDHEEEEGGDHVYYDDPYSPEFKSSEYEEIQSILARFKMSSPGALFLSPSFPNDNNIGSQDHHQQEGGDVLGQTLDLIQNGRQGGRDVGNDIQDQDHEEGEEEEEGNGYCDPCAKFLSNGLASLEPPLNSSNNRRKYHLDCRVWSAFNNS